jgi:antitoxin (DNA-binding transcriptional repressor) of toxin-antitoxin stability system
MKSVNIHDAKTHFSSLLSEIEDSNVSFVICRHGAPVADLVPHKIKNRIKPHPALSKIKLKYNPIESASEEEWPKNIR